MDILGGEVDFSVDGLMGCFEAEFTLAFVNVNGLGGAGALREPIDSNSSTYQRQHPAILLIFLGTRLMRMLTWQKKIKPTSSPGPLVILAAVRLQKLW